VLGDLPNVAVELATQIGEALDVFRLYAEGDAVLGAFAWRFVIGLCLFFVLFFV
jgi:hypothetical protein